jgi:hypothetical protein
MARTHRWAFRKFLHPPSRGSLAYCVLHQLDQTPLASPMTRQLQPGPPRGGRYLTWLVRGRIRITVDHQGGPNAVVSGVFLDPAE